MSKIDKLVNSLNPRAKVPQGFGLWSRPLQLVWLKQNQRKTKGV